MYPSALYEQYRVELPVDRLGDVPDFVNLIGGFSQGIMHYELISAGVS